MSVITTLSFYGRTEEAMAVYREILGAEIVFQMRFRDCPDPSLVLPGKEDLIFHASFRIDGTEFMASDVGTGDRASDPRYAGFSLLLRFDSVERAKETFDALAAQGQVVIPMAESAFSSWYGIVTDRFGVSWKFNVQRPDA